MCGHENTEHYGHIYEEGYLVEYLVRCTDCNEKIGVWAYGNYEDLYEGEPE